MIANREMGMDDYLAMARRRLVWVLIPAPLAALLGFVISFAPIPKYTSRALLMVEGQVVPTGYVAPIVTARVSQRMITLQQNVLSRSRLQPLVTRLGLVRNGKTVDEAIDQIRGNVFVAPQRKGGVAGTTADVSGFFVSYTADNPRDAQQVCAEIASALLAENLELREQVARSTTEFLSRQLEQAKHRIDDMESKVSQFKIQHVGRLPGDLESNLRILASMNSQLDASTQNINRMQQDKSHTEELLEGSLAAWNAEKAAPTYSTLRQQLIRMQNQLVLLQTRYTDDFPDVIKTKHEVEELQAKLKEINSDAENSDASLESTVPREGATMEPGQIRAQREHIYRIGVAIERAIAAQKRLQDRIDQFQSRFSMDAGLEEEWKQLTRDNSTAHGIYNQLLVDKSTAEISTEMEHSQQGEQLKLLDPATLPNSPSYPDRWKFTLYGLGGGLGVGLIVAIWLEFQDKTIRNEGDVLAALELPMLGSVTWAGVEANGNGWTGKMRHKFIPRLKEGEKTR